MKGRAFDDMVARRRAFDDMVARRKVFDDMVCKEGGCLITWWQG